MKIVAFTTDDDLYLQHSKLLVASLRKLKLDLYLEVVPADDWQKIIAFKPTFIQRMRQQFEEPILYIDVDAFVHQDVSSLLDGVEEDIGAHYYLGKEFTSGTLFVNNTPSAYQLIDSWVLEMKKDPTRWDQKVLEELVERHLALGKLTVNRLAPEYTYIFDRTPQYYPHVGAPIVEHLQASRESRFAKQWMNSGVIKRWWLTSPFLNKRYKRLLYRRTFAQGLAKSVNIDLDFSSLI